MDCNTDFVVFRISKTKDVTTSARKYRDLRLEALKTSPASFSSTYETEAAFSDDKWVEILTSPRRETFICAAITRQENDQQVSDDASKWVGQVTLRAPSFSEHLAKSMDLEDEIERWQMLSLFTCPDYRGQGLGKKLCQELLVFIRGYRRQPKVAELSLIVKAHNTAAVKLYERLGFIQVRRCTLVDALIANGECHLLPADRSAPKYTDLSGLLMTFSILRP